MRVDCIALNDLLSLSDYYIGDKSCRIEQDLSAAAARQNLAKL
jgi:hypothetical protein